MSQTYDNKAITGKELQALAEEIVTDLNTKQDQLTEMTTQEVEQIIENIGDL